MTFSYRVQLKGYSKSLFWEKADVSDISELERFLIKTKIKEQELTGDDRLKIQLSPYFLDENDKFQTMDNKELSLIEKNINKKDNN